jgi:uncharacterized C2H2 Zn-finger protein
MSFACSRCGEVFKTRFNLDRHRTKQVKCPIKHENVNCKYCGKIFSRLDNLQRHYDKCQAYILEHEKLKLENEKLKWMKETKAELKTQIIEETQLNIEPKVINSDRNKYDYKLLEAEKYEKPDLSNLSIDKILSIIDNCTNVFEADQKILEAFYLQSNIGKISNIRLADLQRNKMLLADDNHKWINAPAHDECSIIVEHIGSSCYGKLCEYYNDKMKEYDLDTDDDLEKKMLESTDPKYRKLWHIHMITNGHFLRNQVYNRSNKVANYIYDYQIPKIVYSKNGSLYIKEKKKDVILTQQIDLIG